MRVSTYEALSAEEKKEVSSLTKRFIAAVMKTKLGDGYEFARHYKIVEENGYYFCTDGKSPLAGIRSKSKKTMEALFEDACMNYGR